MTLLRLLLDDSADGAWNMAVDEALWHVAGEENVPVLRLYGWMPATVSLGYFQAASTRETHPRSSEAPWVRRATGGGAIVHDCELTYCLVWPLQGAAAPPTVAGKMYRLVHQVFQEVLTRRGCRLTLWDGPKTRSRDRGFPYLCFQRRSPGDGLIGPHKVLGSAQRRNRYALWQHGSLLWRASDYAPELPGVADLEGWSGNSREIGSSWGGHLAQALGCRLVPSKLGEWERRIADKLRREKYGSIRWNLRR